MAYALETFVQILEQDQHHANLACNPQIESLLEKARSLRDLCDKLSFPIIHPKSGDLESRIRDVVYKSEDLIESHIRDQVLSVLEDGTSELDLKNFMEEFDSIKGEIFKIQAHLEPVSSALAAGGIMEGLGEYSMEGFKDSFPEEISFPAWKDLNKHVDSEPFSSAITGPSSVSRPGPNSNMVGLTGVEYFHSIFRGNLNLQADPEPDSSAIAGSSSVSRPEPNSYMWGLTNDFMEENLNIQADLEPDISAIAGSSSVSRPGPYSNTVGLTEDFMEDFDSIMEENLSIQADPEPDISAIAGPSSVSDPAPNSNMVGLTEDFHQLLDQLVGRGPRLQILPIVGMGGIGKTTLAQQLFHHQRTVEHFDSRVWITIPQESSVRAALLTILGRLANLTNEMRKLDDDQLGKIIHMLLRYHKYLIVIDDIWDVDTWDKIRRVCPGNENCSRIILTTRISTFYATGSSNHYNMRFMNASESWELLCLKVFGEERFPPELEKVGKMIAERCQGLPLAIISMAQLLSKIDMKLEHWKQFAMSANSMDLHLDSEADILSKSYNHLSCNLKPCFLYVGAFIGDHEIRVSRIVNLWIAEGFVSGKNLEDIAEEYIKALSDENLLLVCQTEPNGRIRTFKIHFLLRKLCEKKAFEENFLWYKHLEDHRVPEDKDQLRRVSMHPLEQPTNTMKLASLVRSFLCVGHYSQRLAPWFLGFTLLRVLDVFHVEFFRFPQEVLELVLLRYLSFSCHSNLPSSISRLRNLQTLVVRRLPSFREVSLPSELWELSQLRHIKCKQTCIWYFSENGMDASNVNLQTLSNIQVFVVTDSLLDKIQNLRKLGLFCNKLVQSVIHLDRLSKLEKLKCSSNLSQATHNFLSYLRFPPSLRKLTLTRCKIPWGFMETVGLLPNLEQLKLQKCAFPVKQNKPTEVDLEMEDETESTWEQAESQFSALISLQMEDLNLVCWKANESHFPKLEHLIIRGCSSLREIPVGIEESSSIKLIEVDEYCSPSVIASAKDKLKKHIHLGDALWQMHSGRNQETSKFKPLQLDEECSYPVIASTKDKQKNIQVDEYFSPSPKRRKHIDLEDDILRMNIGRIQVLKSVDYMNLGPGFRFHPTDEELITHYLSKKVLDVNFTCVAIGEVDMSKVEPWDLPLRAQFGENEWYFFCARDKKYSTRSMSNRVTAAGYWKSTGKDREILRGKTLVGMKKTLVFYTGSAPRGSRSDWVTHEYRLEGQFSLDNLGLPVENYWVINKVYNKAGPAERVQTPHPFP